MRKWGLSQTARKSGSPDVIAVRSITCFDIVCATY
jgi:hypothetical protein